MGSNDFRLFESEFPVMQQPCGQDERDLGSCFQGQPFISPDADKFAHENHPSLLSGSTTIGDAGEGVTLPGAHAKPRTQTQIIAHDPVPGIVPVDGWRLYTYDEWDREGFRTPGYTARRGDDERLLNVSRFRFTPSQDRFAWLVRNGFPASPRFGPWDDTDIELRMAMPALGVAA